jgi:hypothetical protein
MKSFLKSHTKQAELEYPCLKTKKDTEGHTIVLFSSFREGTCVHTTRPQNFVGDYSTNWGEEFFEPFTGELVLKN